MQVIITKYLPCTITKPARVKAIATNGESVIVSYYAHAYPHRHAAAVLAKKLDWLFLYPDWQEGTLPDVAGEYVFVPFRGGRESPSVLMLESFERISP